MGGGASLVPKWGWLYCAPGRLRGGFAVSGSRRKGRLELTMAVGYTTREALSYTTLPLPHSPLRDTDNRPQPTPPTPSLARIHAGGCPAPAPSPLTSGCSAGSQPVCRQPPSLIHAAAHSLRCLWQAAAGPQGLFISGRLSVCEWGTGS